MSNVAIHIFINTDEHGAYAYLLSFNFIHGNLYQKYEFMNRITGVNIQGIESFYNELNSK